MRKVDQIRFWLAADLPPRQIAERVGCSLSLVYATKGVSGMARVRHQVAVLQEELHEVQERLRRLEGGPSIIERRLSENGVR